MNYQAAVLSAVALSMACTPKHETAAPRDTHALRRDVVEATLQQRPLEPAPSLDGLGEAARRSVAIFLEWASRSVGRQRAELNAALWSARHNREIARELFEAALTSWPRDSGRALVALALLGEMRSDFGEEYLKAFLQLASTDTPTRGALTPNAYSAQIDTLSHLKAKAIDGLAYLKTDSADQEVLRSIAEDPSPLVRAEAVMAYLWNHQDSNEARITASGYIRKGEELLLDRIRRDYDDSGESYNRKLAAYLQAHPQVIASPQPDEHAARPDQVEEIGLAGDQQEAM